MHGTAQCTRHLHLHSTAIIWCWYWTVLGSSLVDIAPIGTFLSNPRVQFWYNGHSSPAILCGKCCCTIGDHVRRQSLFCVVCFLVDIKWRQCGIICVVSGFVWRSGFIKFLYKQAGESGKGQLGQSATQGSQYRLHCNSAYDCFNLTTQLVFPGGDLNCKSVS